MKVDPEGLTLLAEQAMADVSHLLRPLTLPKKSHSDDPEATDNDRFVALEMIKNAVISSNRVLPMCQDTGTALVNVTRGEQVLTGGEDEKALSRGIYNTYQSHNLRFSQLYQPCLKENTANNLPAQIDIAAGAGAEYKFTFIQKGGFCLAFLHQKTRRFRSRKFKIFKRGDCLAWHSGLSALSSGDCYWPLLLNISEDR